MNNLELKREIIRHEYDGWGRGDRTVHTTIITTIKNPIYLSQKKFENKTPLMKGGMILKDYFAQDDAQINKCFKAYKKTNDLNVNEVREFLKAEILAANAAYALDGLARSVCVLRADIRDEEAEAKAAEKAGDKTKESLHLAKLKRLNERVAAKEGEINEVKGGAVAAAYKAAWPYKIEINCGDPKYAGYDAKVENMTVRRDGGLELGDDIFYDPVPENKGGGRRTRRRHRTKHRRRRRKGKYTRHRRHKRRTHKRRRRRRSSHRRRRRRHQSKQRGGDGYDKARKKWSNTKPCGKYYTGKYGINKKGCKKNKECRYVTMGSGGEWCYPALSDRKKEQEKLRKKTQRAEIKKKCKKEKRSMHCITNVGCYCRQRNRRRTKHRRR